MDYLQLVQDTANRASAGGAEAESIVIISQQSQIQVDQGQVEKLSQAGSKGLGVRIIHGGRMGYAFTSDFAPDAIEDTWRGALSLAKAADPDPHRALPERRPIDDEDLEIYDPSLAETPMEAKVELALQVEQAALAADPRVVLTNRGTYLDGISSVYLANSSGFAGCYDSTFAAAYIIGIGRDAGGQTMGMGLGASVYLADLDPHAVGTEAGQNAARILGGAPVPTQEATAILDPLATAQLVGNLAQALTAQAMQRGRSFLIDRVGQEIASDMVSLLDNGRLTRGMASSPFDAEGMPTSATRLIDEGVLQAVLHDSYTARVDGQAESTGNASRSSHRTPPSLAPSNFYLQPGQLAPEEIIAGVERGLYVTNTMNVGGINPVSGDYSVGASGLWIENGQLTRPVTEVTVALHLNDLLKNITAVGNDLRFVPFGGVIGAPTIRVDGATIAGR
jgi:PmbA protein